MKKAAAFLLAVVTAFTALCTNISANAFSLYPEVKYSYYLKLSGSHKNSSVSLTDKTRLELPLFSGAETILSDNSGHKETVILSDVKLNGSPITKSSVGVGSVFSGTENIIPVNSEISLSFTANAVIKSKSYVDPGTLIDIKKASVPLKAEFFEKEKSIGTVDFSSSVSVEVFAVKEEVALSSDITYNCFNGGKGLKRSQTREITVAEDAFIVTAELKNPLQKPSALSVSTNLNPASVSVLMNSGDKRASVTLSKNYFYDVDFESIFEKIFVRVDGASVPLKSVKVSYTISEMSKQQLLAYPIITLNKGTSYNILNKAASLCESENKAVAEIIKSGTAKAISVGSTVLNVYDAYWRITQCKINVINSSKPITALSLPYSDCIIRVGKAYSLNIAATPASNTDKITWVSSDPSVVKIDISTGKFIGAAPGTAKITAVSSSGKSASCTVTVKMPE